MFRNSLHSWGIESAAHYAAMSVKHLFKAKRRNRTLLLMIRPITMWPTVLDANFNKLFMAIQKVQ